MSFEKANSGVVPISFVLEGDKMSISINGAEPLVVDTVGAMSKHPADLEVRIGRSLYLERPIEPQTGVPGGGATARNSKRIGYLKSEIDRAYDAQEA